MDAAAIPTVQISRDRTFVVFKIPASYRSASLLWIALTFSAVVAATFAVCLQSEAADRIICLVLGFSLAFGLFAVFWGYKRMTATHLLKVDRREVTLRRMLRWRFVHQSIPVKDVKAVEQVVVYTKELLPLTRVEIRSDDDSLTFGSVLDDSQRRKIIRQISRVLSQIRKTGRGRKKKTCPPSPSAARARSSTSS